MDTHSDYLIRGLRKAKSYLLIGLIMTISATAPSALYAGNKYEKSEKYDPKLETPALGAVDEYEKYDPPKKGYLDESKLCGKKKIKEILAPATAANPSVKLDCSLSLENSNHTITKRIDIVDSGVHLDCGNSTIKPTWYNNEYGELNIYTEKRDDGVVHRVTDVTIKNCTIYGRIMIFQQIHGRTSSQNPERPGHTSRAQGAAPSNITLDNLTIIGSGLSGDGTMVYFYPGVTYSKLINSEIKGDAPMPDGGGIYLDAETAHLTIKNNYIHAKTHHREQMSIDGSAHNRIVGNTFSALNHGGIYIYRNCGESGGVRHQWPRQNQIINNIFYYDKYDGELPSIWVGSRNQKTRDNDIEYCHLDDGFPFGSGASNEDFAKYNAIGFNRIRKLQPREMIRIHDEPTFLYENEMTYNRTPRKSGCFLYMQRPIFLQHGESAVQKFMLEASDKFTCNDNELVKETLQADIVPFLCGVSNDNSGRMCNFKCPEGKQVVAIKAGCSLELDAQEFGSWFPRIVENLLHWDQLKVFMASENVNQGYCGISPWHDGYVYNVAKDVRSLKTYWGTNKGSISLLGFSGTANGIWASCVEHDTDDTGGDCVIVGELACL